MLSKIKTFIFPKYHTRYGKNVWDQIAHLKKIYKFFLLLIKNGSLKIKNSMFPPKYTRYDKNFKEKSCSFQKNLQLWSWSDFHRSNIFYLIMKNIIKNKQIFLSKTMQNTENTLRNKIVYIQKTWKITPRQSSQKNK